MNTSEQINELAAALAKAQAAIQPAKKDRDNPAFKGSKYADLASVWDACREPLTANGLSVVQLPTDSSEPDRVALVTTLLHSSGQWISGMVSTRIAKNDPQGVGSALTYLRRYALSAMVGVAPDDDDGNAASQTTPRNEPARYSPPVQPQPDQEIVKAKLAFLAFATEHTNERINSWRDVLNWLGVDYSEPVSVQDWRNAAVLIRNEIKTRTAKPQPLLSDEWADIEDTSRKDGATKAIAK